jgi:competence protein ComEA
MDETPRQPPPPCKPETSEIVLRLTWPRCAQVTTCVLLSLGIGFLLGKWHGDGPRPAAAESALARTDSPRLDLNRATGAELRLLPGLGDTLARRVEEHRRAHGPFRSVDDLRKVGGIGPVTLERLRPWLFVDTTPAAPGPVVAVAATPARGKKQAALAEPIDVNQADRAELQKLPGIGPKMSQRIADERLLRGPFRTVDDLRRVSGIGPKTLERLRPYVTVGAAPAVAQTSDAAPRSPADE